MVEVKDEKLQRRLREDRLAADVIDECRVQLMLKFRFLDRALWRMELEPVRAGGAYPLATNGHIVAYDPPRVVARFQASFDEAIRDYLHMVLHCIFRHPYSADRKDREAWSLTCDMIAESVAMDLCAGRFPSEDDATRAEALGTVRLLAGSLLPGKVYELVHGLMQTPDGQQHRGLGREVLREWQALFERDEHAAWPALSEGGGNEDEGMPRGYAPHEADDEGDQAVDPAAQVQDALDAGELPESMRDQLDAAPDAGEETGEQAGGDDDAAAASAVQPQEAGHEEHGSDPLGNFQDTDAHEQDEREWQDIAQEIEMSLSTFSKEWGDEAAAFAQNLHLANRRRYDYSEFLRQFMVRSEEMLVNPDEFDYVYYSYGMQLYGNMPLVEPLEYQETERVRDLVIAIDTSESVRGDLVRRFVERTFELLKGAQDFAREVCIHVVQCDSRLQEDMIIRDLADVDALMERFCVRGFGGTDFRPVFDYVQGMRDDGKLPNLRGLIYFTDGLGTFPEAPLDYDAAFVFMEDEAHDPPPVPPWAIKLVIEEEQLT